MPFDSFAMWCAALLLLAFPSYHAVDLLAGSIDHIVHSSVTSGEYNQPVVSSNYHFMQSIVVLLLVNE